MGLKVHLFLFDWKAPNRNHLKTRNTRIYFSLSTLAFGNTAGFFLFLQIGDDRLQVIVKFFGVPAAHFTYF